MGLNTLLITQARIGSTRLPGKVLKQIDDKTLLQIHLERIAKSKKVSKAVIATTTNPGDQVIVDFARRHNIDCFKGSEFDVLDRYYQCASQYKPEWVVRVTSDCPLLDYRLIDEVIGFVQSKGVDYGSNILVERFPDGQDIEVFTYSALEKSWKKAEKLSEREHVTPYLRSNSDFMGGNIFKAVNYDSPANYSHIRMTVDEQRDLEMITQLVKALGTDRSWTEYVQYMIESNLTSINENIIRNEGFLKSKSKD